MSTGKTLMLMAGFVGGLAVGLAVSPVFYDRGAAPASAAPAVADSQPDATPAPAPAAAPRRARPAARPAAATIPASRADLHARLKPVLNRGADMTIAADGFKDAEQFAIVAHASRNTKVPFMLLKHRVLTQGKSLSSAIRASKPDADVASEVNWAREEARADLAALAS